MATSKRDPLYNAAELRRAFDEARLDAIIARSGRNVAYLSGMSFPGTLGRLQDFAHSPRAALIVWPKDGDATLLVSNIAAGLARQRSWLDDIRTFAEYHQSPFHLTAAVLKERGLGRGRIGVWWHQEEPVLIPGERRRLRPNMVVCLEPILAGYWHLQDEILISESDPTLLSDTFDTSHLFSMG